MSSPRMWMGPMLSPSSSLMDEDPGIMSEAETSSTGFRRGVKQRSSLPVVRTTSKTLERPLGLVFLQYGKETKRALLPNEITTMDTVRALFVRSFSHQLTMEYLSESANVRIYIHDANKDVFYELEDLRDIKDRSILRLFETQGPNLPMSFPSSFSVSGSTTSLSGPLVGMSRLAHTSPPSSLNSAWMDHDQSYFSEPEFDSEYQHQHVHKAKSNKPPMVPSSYYGPFGANSGGGRPTYNHHNSSTAGPLIQPVASMTSSPSSSQRALHRSSFTPAVERSVSVPVPGMASAAAMEQQVNSTSGKGSRVGGAPGPTAYGPLSINVIHGDGLVSGPPSLVRSMSHTQPSPLHHSSSSGPPRPPERSYSHAASAFLSPSAAYPPASQPLYGRPAIFDNGYGVPPLSPAYLIRSGATTPVFDDETRIRMEHVERQLASLTGLVQTALTVSGASGASVSSSAAGRVQSTPGGDGRAEIGAKSEPNILITNHGLSTASSHEIERNPFTRNNSTGGSCSSTLGTGTSNRLAAPKLGRDKCVSFEKSVSFSDEPIEFLPGGKHSPQPTESKPAKPAIKSSTLPRTSSQALLQRGDSVSNAETANQLRMLQKRARDLRQEMRNLRRLTLAQSAAVKDAVRDTVHLLKNTFLVNSDIITAALSGDSSLVELSLRKIHCDEDNYQREMRRLEKELSELEVSVEDLRSSVIIKKTRVSMADVEHLVVMLNQSSKTVADLKTQFPALQESIKKMLAYQMDKVVDEEKFLAEEPAKLENTMRRCKKLTSTLVTLKRLASVQEQRQPVLMTTKDNNVNPAHGLATTVVSKSFPTAVSEVPATEVPQTGTQGCTATDVGRQLHAADGTQLQHAADGATSPGVAAPWSADRRSTPGPGTSKESTAPPLPPRPRLGNANPLDALLNELQSFNQSRKQESEADSGESLMMMMAPTSGNGRRPLTSSSSVESSDSKSSYAESSVDSVVATSGSSGRRAPPPPPPRTSSRSPLMSPQGTLMQASVQRYRPLPDPPAANVPVSSGTLTGSPFLVSVGPHLNPASAAAGSGRSLTLPNRGRDGSRTPVSPSRLSVNADDRETLKSDQLSLSSRSSSSESVNSQEGNPQPPPATPQSPPTQQPQQVQVQDKPSCNGGSIECGPVPPPLPARPARPTADSSDSSDSSPKKSAQQLEQRHQELLRKQKQLQEQYNRLQQLQQRTRPTPAAAPSARPLAIAMGVAMLQQQQQQLSQHNCSAVPSSSSPVLTCPGSPLLSPRPSNSPAEANFITKTTSPAVDRVEQQEETDQPSMSATQLMSSLLGQAHETDII